MDQRDVPDRQEGGYPPHSPGGSYVKGDKAYQTMQGKIEELLKEQ